MLIQFDFDGCLGDTIPGIYAGVCHVFVSCGLVPPTFVSYLTELRAPYTEFYRKRGVTLSEKEIWDRFRERAEMNHKKRLFPDVVPEVSRLVREGHVLTIVSGNHPESIWKMLAEADIVEAFKVVSGELEHKSEAFRKNAFDLGFSESNSIVVGDSALDIEYGREAGMQSIGIIRYPYLVDGDSTALKQALIQAGARHCIDSLAELLAV